MPQNIPSTRTEMAALIDHTQVNAHASQADITQLCAEAQQHGFGAITVNSAWTSYCTKQLDGTDVGINTTIGFPLGATTSFLKVTESREALENGATELDMVINLGALKSGFPEYIEREVHAVVEIADDTPVKVILETCYLTDEEKRQVCELSVKAGAAYVKTSTGFGETGATLEDVRLMRAVVGDQCGVKAAGGIRTLEMAKAMLNAGADRLGTSAGVQILTDFPA